MIGGVLFSRATPASTPHQRIRWFLVMAVLLAIGGYFFRPLYGISKNMATPAWSLYSAAACCILFLGLYWIADIQRKGSLFRFAAPAGSNPLLAYILPDIFYGLLAIAGIGDLWGALGAGTPGIVRSLAFSLFMVWLTGRLSGSGLQLKL
jgi:predicted acyltransferase